jgi:hypothetical protein
MNRIRTVCVALSSVAVLSCSVAPVKVVTGDQCFRCRRPILNERLAAETISGEGARFVAKFRGPGCMAKYLVEHPDAKAVVYVTDYASGRMIPPAGAFYVSQIVERNTGEIEYRAYGHQADAQSAAAELNSAPLSWNEVLDKAR